MVLVVDVVDTVTLVNSILDIIMLIAMKVQDLEVVVVTVVGIRVVHNEEIVDTKVVLIALNLVVDTKDNLHHEMMIMVDMQSVQDSIMDLAHKVDDHNSLIEILVEVKVTVTDIAHHVVEVMTHSFQRYLKF